MTTPQPEYTFTLSGNQTTLPPTVLRALSDFLVTTTVGTSTTVSPDNSSMVSTAISDSTTSTLLEESEQNPGIRGVVPFSETLKADEEMEWDGPGQMAKCEDTEEAKAICAWYDADKPDMKSSYKLPHHLAEEGYPVVWAGVRAAMGRLMQTDMPDDDRRGVYNHLAQHYEQFDKKPPEYNDLVRSVPSRNLTSHEIATLAACHERLSQESIRSSLTPEDRALLDSIEALRSRLQVEHPIEIRAITDDTITVAGWLCVFGGKDLYGTRFTSQTDFWIDKLPREKPILFEHSFDPMIGNDILGYGSVEVRSDYGVWIQAQLDRHKEYMEAVLQLIKFGVLGWSSGSASHLVRMGDDNVTIECWPIFEGSLTAQPAEPRTLGIEVMRSLAGTSIDPDLYPTHFTSVNDAVGTDTTLDNQETSTDLVVPVSEPDPEPIRSTPNLAIFLENTSMPDEGNDILAPVASATTPVAEAVTPVATATTPVAAATRAATPTPPTIDVAALAASVTSQVTNSLRLDNLTETIVSRVTDSVMSRMASEAPPVRNIGYSVPTSSPRNTIPSGAEALRAFESYLRYGDRMNPSIRAALNEGTPGQGGYTVPEEWNNEIIQQLREGSIMRQLGARTYSFGATDRLHIPSQTFGSAAVLSAEAGLFDQQEPTFGEIVFVPYKYTQQAVVSDELLADSMFDVWGQLLQPNFAQAFIYAENTALTTGSGAAQPHGIVAASTAGVTTAGATAITPEEIIDLIHSVDHLYRRNAVFMMHDLVLKYVRKLKDGQNNFLWEPSYQTGNPSILVGHRVITNNFMASAVATTNRTIWFGDASYYAIADRAGMEVRRLDEILARQGQVAFIAFKRFDGRVVLGEAMRVMVQA